MQISKDFSSEVYTTGVQDGGTHGGFGVYFGNGCPLNVSAPYPEKETRKERAELAAILSTLMIVKKKDDLNAIRLWNSFNETVRVGIGRALRTERIEQWIAKEFAHAPADRRKNAVESGTWELGLHIDILDEQCAAFDAIVEEMVEPVVIYSDSPFSFNALQSVLPLWDRNWKPHGQPPPHMDLMVPIAELLKERAFTEPRGTLWRGRVELEVVKDPNKTEGALKALQLARRGAEVSMTEAAKSHIKRLESVGIVQAIEEIAEAWTEARSEYQGVA